MLKKRNLFLILIALVPLTFILTQCFNGAPPDPRGEVYAGSASCQKCHKAQYDSYIQTAHYTTSRQASPHTISGSFAKGLNSLDYGYGLKVVMENRGDSLYQAAYQNGKQTGVAPFDISIGGVKAETYLYWKGKQLYELPVSYFSTIHSWANSPGYIPDRVNFNRPILRKCLECHTSYISELPPDGKELGFEKASLIMGIDCERCHGPAANHVNFHTDNPDEKKPKYITTYKSLTRSQKMDACAVCHSGNKMVPQKSTFDFQMGDTLNRFVGPDAFAGAATPPTLDVHGNQNALLSSSKCYIMTNMDCGTCHNPHVKQEQNIALFTQKCLSCHSEAQHNFCTLAPKLGTAINTYCINCHMPQKASHVISLTAFNGKMNPPYEVRTHHIAIYPGETKKVMAFIKGEKVK
ncbi:multiheme c-type cytochrome [Mucilaginibacter sp. FT3.2]|uniref:multiheme c-type cytochrome n=1 Tax=Mucilaginibacter sp. FT3.2 TaxID=2723090 RepID=UPI001611D543|nr:multiheme c-type cytochrome [Mucilaginibacter sp. FT3.2]MBB6230354.1 nitrate reductase cytochrome c-type subunit [Mucilaginibacter sp. FT3.2]